MTTLATIAGIGQTAVGEHWSISLRHLAWQAIEAALDDAAANGLDALNEIEAVYVGNMLGGMSSQQDHLGALVADYAGLRGVEAVTVEAAEASGGAAVRQAVLAVMSGQIKVALAVGVEKATDQTGSASLASQTTSLDADFEVIHGATPAAMAGLMMRRYMHEYGVSLENFAGFSVNAHANGALNERAMYRNKLRADKFAGAPLVAEPVNLFDAAPVADGAAAVILISPAYAAELGLRNGVQVAGSSVVTAAFSLHDRDDVLWLEAVAESGRRALRPSGLGGRRDEFGGVARQLHDYVNPRPRGVGVGGARPWLAIGARGGDWARRPSAPQHLWRPESAGQSAGGDGRVPDCGGGVAIARPSQWQSGGECAHGVGAKCGRHGRHGRDACVEGVVEWVTSCKLQVASDL